MKISKAKLRQTIKEELSEGGRPQTTDNLVAAVKAALWADLDHEEIRGIVDDYLDADRLKYPAGR